MERKFKNIFLVGFIILLSAASSCAEEVQTNLNTNNQTVESLNLENSNLSIASAATLNLVTPIVEDTKAKKKTNKINLKAVIFDPNAQIDAQAEEEGREMTKVEQAEYNLNEALHGEVQTLSTKGLLADKLKINVDGKYIDNIQPWVDYNGYFSNSWSNADYKNTLYSINFADFGFHVNTKDNVYHAKFMFSPVKSIEGRTYFQTLFADNYVTRKIGKHNMVLVGNTWLPIGFEGQESPLVWQYFNRSQTSMRYSSVRTLGTKLMGDYKYANYQVGFYSAGRAFTDWFPGPEFAGWVEFKPLANLDAKKYGKLTIGAGLNSGNAQLGDYNLVTGGVKYEYKRIKAITEFGTANGSNGALGYSANKSKGINGTLVYRLTPRTEISGRYDVFDPNCSAKNDIRTEYTVGLNYYIKDYAARIILNGTIYSIENGTYGSRLLVGTQIVL